MKAADEENIQCTIPLNLFQKQILYSILMNKSSNSYMEQARYHLVGAIDLDCIIQAWELTVKANENLRSVFCWEDQTEPIQIVYNQKHIAYEVYDLTALQRNDQETAVQCILQRKWHQKVDLTKTPFQLTFCRLHENLCEIIISIHHLLIDGWSNLLMLKRFVTCYNDLSNKRNLPEQCAPSYSDFVNWSNNLNRQKAKNFWKSYLNGALYVPLFAQAKYPLQGFAYYSLPFLEISDRIEQYIKQHQITLAAFLFGVWGILRMILNGQSSGQFDLIFAITVSGRNLHYPNIESILGMLIKTIPLRVKGTTFINADLYFQQIRNDLAELLEFSYMDWAEILYNRYLTQPINDVVVIQNYPVDDLFKTELDVSGGNGETQSAALKFVSSCYENNSAVTIGCMAFKRNLTIDFCFDKSRISVDEMKKIRCLFKDIVSLIIMNPNLSIDGIIRLLAVKKEGNL